MKINYDEQYEDFEPLLQVFKSKNEPVFCVQNSCENVQIDPEIACSVMFNILGFYLRMLEDKQQLNFVNIVKHGLNDMMENRFEHLHKGTL